MTISNLVNLSLRRRSLILIFAFFLILIGTWSALNLPIDAVPDITSPTVQINTEVQALAPEEIEKLVTFPIESEMAGIPSMVELRSLSKIGLSQVTMIFRDDVDIYRIRQLITERLQHVLDVLPSGSKPMLAPISTGLGEIYHYSLQYKKDALNIPQSRYEQLLQLSQIQEYTVKPLLRSTQGVAEVNTSGGYEKQIVINPDPQKVSALGLTLKDISDSVSENVTNAGGGFVEIGAEQLVIRSATRVSSIEQIKTIPLKFGSGVLPVTLADVAEVSIGSNYRTGASTYNGNEAVVGGAIMLMGENSRLVAHAVEQKIHSISEKLPSNVEIVTVYNRSYLIDLTIGTVEKSLFEGAILVLVILCAMLGNWRAAIIVASAIPLSMLFAVTGMVYSKISGNLMSLGAIDFGLIIDGSVVMVENIFRHLSEKQHQLGRKLSAQERFEEVMVSAKEVANPMFFGVLIITIVYLPILALAGIEGKMFHPMAWTVMFALIGSLILSLTLMPVLCSYFLTGELRETDNALVSWFKGIYRPILNFTLNHRAVTVSIALTLFLTAAFTFTRLGAVFIPQLNEGAILLQFIRGSSVGLTASLDLQEHSEKVLLEKFPEILYVYSRIGTAEIATDPMGPNVADTYIFYKPENEWRKIDGNTITKDELIELMRRELTIHVPGQILLFTQPIQMRFNEIMAGARADLSVKIFGDDFVELERLADEIRNILRKIPGGGDVEFEPIGRSPMLEISPDREKLRRLNVHSQDINDTVTVSLGGEEAGVLTEGNRRIPVIVRLKEELRQELDQIKRLPVKTDSGGIVPLGQLASISVQDAIGSISREANQRRVAILINLRGRDVESFVNEAARKIKDEISFPDGYYYEFGGQFENLQSAKKRLMIVVPVGLALIFFLIFLVFQSFRQAVLVFLCVPLAATGGVFALAIRGIPFSISAGVGFIALSGIAVLNGLMLITFINQLRREGKELREAIVEGALTRLRPKIMTALVASFGFVPMAIATGAGAEVQRPLATVVIGGVMSSLFLTLVVLPTLYEWIESKSKKEIFNKHT